jgi:hypothetical protein
MKMIDDKKKSIMRNAISGGVSHSTLAIATGILATIHDITKRLINKTD